MAAIVLAAENALGDALVRPGRVVVRQAVRLMA
jgi:hypothetical protein